MKNKDREIKRLILESIKHHENHINFHKKECEKYRKAYANFKHTINKGKTPNIKYSADALIKKQPSEILIKKNGNRGGFRVGAGRKKRVIGNVLLNNEINNYSKRTEVGNSKNVKLLKGTIIQWKKIIIDYFKKEPKFKSLDQIISDLFPFKSKEAQEILKRRCYDVLFKYEKSGIINSRIIENKKHYSILRKTILYK